MKAKFSFLASVAAVATLFTMPWASAQQRLSYHVPAPITRPSLQPLGSLPQTNRLNLTIGLPLRNRQALTNLLQEIYDPASPNYRHYLKPDQFAERFSPTSADYEAVAAFLRTKGWLITRRDPRRMQLHVNAAVSDVERVCHVRMRTYQHPSEARTFFAPDATPSLDLATPVLDISGIDNYELPRPANLESNPIETAIQGTGSSPDGSLIGYDFRRAYAPGVALEGEGQIVGLVAFNGFFTNDIVAYETMAGLPNVPVVFESVDGYDGTANTNSYMTVGEVSLDIEMVISMAPGLSKLIVYECGPSGSGNDILEQMANDNTASQLSSSYLFAANATTDNYLQRLAAQGQSFFIGAGNHNAYTNGAKGLVDHPYVTSVGGTSLRMSPERYRVSETVWNEDNTWGSSGGISTLFSIPSWQQGTSMSTNGGSATMRNIPDVAMASQNVWTIAKGVGHKTEGTSCASPLWAGFTALINQRNAALGNPRIGFINPAIYRLGNSPGYAAAFHDITTGSNTNADSHNLFRAVPGYDLCTGWGTPNGMNLINALTITDPLFISPSSGFSATAVAGPFDPVTQSFYLTNLGSSPLSWSVTGDLACLTISPAVGLLAPSAATNLLITLNQKVNRLSMGFYSGSVVFSNLTLGTEQIRQFTVQASLPTLDFDNLISKTNVPVNYGGVNWTNFYAYNAVTGVTPAYGIPMLSSPNVIYNGYGSPASIISTVPFDLLSAELAGVFYDNMNLEVKGYSGTSLCYDTNLTISATVPTAAQFNFYGVTTVSFTSTGGTLYRSGGGEQFAMDNLLIVLHKTVTDTPRLQNPDTSAGTLALTWPAQIGATYQLQCSTNLSPANWINLGTPLTAVNPTLAASCPSANQQMFYRLLLLP